MADCHYEKFFSSEKSPASRTEEFLAEKSPGDVLLKGHVQLSQPRDLNSSSSSRPTHNGKHRISRTRFSTFQKVALESSFLSSLYLTGEERDALAFKLGLSPVTVQTWFKNRRFKWRKESKKADGSHTEPTTPISPVLLHPSICTLPNHLCATPEYQQLQEGLYVCGAANIAPHMRKSINTRWWNWNGPSSYAITHNPNPSSNQILT